jgi:hypothetical protein
VGHQVPEQIENRFFLAAIEHKDPTTTRRRRRRRRKERRR